MYELLAPAGDLERLKFALLYGADAVYIGGQNFSLRANAKNFNNEALKEAVDFAHSLNKKVYVTVNIVFHDEDLHGLDEYLSYLSEINVDGIIVSDIAVLKKVKELNLNLFIVLSTQASTFNEYTVKFWQNLGVKRIVLARETSKEEIKRIIDNTGVEVESFIHGAMCTSISGKCVLSNVATNRDSNRGGCAQVCRWTFKNDDKPDFTMMSKDLNMVDNIEEMMNLGIVSYKIEGRMRSIYYISTIINSYRKIFDLILDNNFTDDKKDYYLKIINRCANRESKPQFFENLPDETDQYFTDRKEETNQDFLGLVKEYDDNNKLVTIEVRNYFKKGYITEFFSFDNEPFMYEIDAIYDENMNELDCANKPKSIVKLKLSQKISENSILRIKI